MIKKGLIADSKERLIFLSVPLSGIIVFLKSQDIYLSLGISLLVAMLCFMTVLYLQHTNGIKDLKASFIHAFGFLLVTSSSVLSDIGGINLLFLLGISILAVYSALDFSFLSIFSYAFIVSILQTERHEYLMSLLLAVFLVLLVKYFSDFLSLIYVLLTLTSLYLLVLLVLNGLSLNNIFTAERVIDISFLLLSTIFSFILFQKKKIGTVFEIEDDALKEEKEEISPITEEEQTFREEESSLSLETEENKDLPPLETEENKDLPPLQLMDDREEKEAEGETSVIEEASSLKEEIEEIKAEEEPAKEEEIDLPVEIPKPDFEPLLTETTFLYKLVKSNGALYKEAKKRSKVSAEIAEMIGADPSLAAAAAFYADCGRLNSENYIKESLKLIKQYRLPDEIFQIAKEHHFMFGKPSSRESAIIMLLFKLDSSIRFFEKKGKKFPASHVIDSVTNTLLMAGKFDSSGLSIGDYKFIKDYLLEEVPKAYDYFH